MCHAQSSELVFIKLFLFSKAFPPAKFFWQFENGTKTRNGAARGFVGPVQRAGGGRYTCTAFNELGNIKTEGESESDEGIGLLETYSFCSSFERVVQARVYN